MFTQELEEWTKIDHVTSQISSHALLRLVESVATLLPNFYFKRIINDWNNLSQDVVNARSINSFKSLLDNFLTDSRFIFL